MCADPEKCIPGSGNGKELRQDKPGAFEEQVCPSVEESNGI